MPLPRLQSLVLCASLFFTAPVPASSVEIDGAFIDQIEIQAGESEIRAHIPSTPERWHYAQAGIYEILSQNSDADTLRQASEILFVDSFVRSVLRHGDFTRRYSQPCLLIFHRTRERYLEFIPAANVGATARSLDAMGLSARRFLRGTEQTALVHIGNLYSNPYAGGSAIVHNIFQQYEPRAPTWFRVATGNLIRIMDPELVWNPRRQFTGLLQRRDLLPMHDLVNGPLPPPRDLIINLDPNAPPSDLEPWHHQITLFAHWGLFGADEERRRQFDLYIRRSSEQPMTEALFRECFGMDYEEMRTVLRDYLGSREFASISLIAERQRHLAGLPRLALQDATPGQSGRIKAEARIMAGYGGDARRELLTAHRHDPNDPELLGSLGISETGASGVSGPALAMLEAAVAADSQRPLVYIQLSRLRHPALMAMAGPDGRYTRAQAEPVLAPLLRAHRLKPASAQLYQCLAVLYAGLSDPLRPDEIAILDEGVRAFPRDRALQQVANRLRLAQSD